MQRPGDMTAHGRAYTGLELGTLYLEQDSTAWSGVPDGRGRHAPAAISLLGGRQARHHCGFNRILVHRGFLIRRGHGLLE